MINGSYVRSKVGPYLNAMFIFLLNPRNGTHNYFHHLLSVTKQHYFLKEVSRTCDGSPTTNNGGKGYPKGYEGRVLVLVISFPFFFRGGGGLQESD